MSNPATYNFEAYYGDTYGLVFVFTDANGDPLDILSTFTELTYDIFTKNKEDDPLVSLSLVSGFTVTDGNKLVGAITAEQNETLFGSPIKYAEMRVTYNGTKETLLKGTYIVNRAQGNQSSNDSPLTLAIDLEAIEVNVSLSLLEVPVDLETILVSGKFPSNSGFRYNDIDLAITRARALIADGYGKVVIRAFLDVNNQPIGLTESYYDLYDEGIIFQSDFDVWKQYVTNGGSLLQSDLLYDVPQNELSINING
jgi:hypothetical protein